MCNCKKHKRGETVVIIGTPEPEVVQPEIDHFNNIDTIEPIQNAEGTTGENG